MIIDDDPDIVEAMKIVLESKDYEVVNLVDLCFDFWCSQAPGDRKGRSKTDPLSGQAIHKQCCVKIYKA